MRSDQDACETSRSIGIPSLASLNGISNWWRPATTLCSVSSGMITSAEQLHGTTTSSSKAASVISQRHS